MQATHGFDKAHEIGEGGFGKVFVGNFSDARALAIKRAAPMSINRQSGHDQFRNEVFKLCPQYSCSASKFSIACNIFSGLEISLACTSSVRASRVVE